MPGGEQQQILVGQGPHKPVLVHAPQHGFQGIVPLLHLQLRHVSPANRPQLPAGHHQFPNGSAVGQQAVQIPAQKAFNAHLPPAAGHHGEKMVELLLGLGTPALHLKAAAEPHHLPHGGIQHRDGLPQFPVHPLLTATQGDKPPQPAEGVSIPAAQLAHRRHAAGFLLPFQNFNSSFRMFP